MDTSTAVPFMDRVSNNIAMTLAEINPYKIIRLVIIVGAYALLRPYAMKLAGRKQEQQFERASAEDVLTANDLRGQLNIPDPDEDDIEDIVARAQGLDGAEATGPSWGKKARKRQRMVMKKMLEQEEERLRQLQEDEEDKDIQEFLHE
ncbi:hypothetical protein TD95_000926 [Thielaviopsis punctulata]|uniref:DUF1531-domain-containing protein n=1 Tax=Thielaviopsis punctulata TaxID=72032 RepID=A0A0F4ZFI4_9PEZI|nr:hypothetical protein TD95_000926 [Thielaviopsis punctulata]